MKATLSVNPAAVDSIDSARLEGARRGDIEVCHSGGFVVLATSGDDRGPPGRAVGAPWQNVDFKRKRFVISEFLEKTKEFGLRFKGPKSGRVQVIPIADAVVDALGAYKVKQNTERLRVGAAYADQDLVFCNEDGSPWPPDTLTK